MSNSIKIFIVDDHAVFRDGLKLLLSQVSGFYVVGEAGSGKFFLDSLKKTKPNIVLMDISMPQMDGIEATQKALEKYPDLKIIALSSYSDHVYYYKMIKAGVQGFVQKKAGKEELKEAINKVAKGENYFPQDILRNLLFKLGNEGMDSTLDQIILSKREIQVLHLICQGFTNIGIATKLNISPKTVDNHRTNLLSKTKTKNSAHLVMFAIKHHIIEV